MFDWHRMLLDVSYRFHLFLSVTTHIPQCATIYTIFLQSSLLCSRDCLSAEAHIQVFACAVYQRRVSSFMITLCRVYTVTICCMYNRNRHSKCCAECGEAIQSYIQRNSSTGKPEWKDKTKIIIFRSFIFVYMHLSRRMGALSTFCLYTLMGWCFPVMVVVVCSWLCNTMSCI